MMKISAKILCILTLFSAAYAQDVQQKERSLISGDRILVKEKNVAKLLANRAYYRKAFIAAKVGMSAYGIASGVLGLLDFFGIAWGETYVKLSDVALAQKKRPKHTPSASLVHWGKQLSLLPHIWAFIICSQKQKNSMVQRLISGGLLRLKTLFMQHCVNCTF